MKLKLEFYEVIEYITLMIVYLSLPLIFDIAYTGSDDYKYMTIVSGCYTGEPSAYTIFMGYLYSAFLSFLYSIYPQVEWYTILHFSLSIFAALSFAYITNHRFQNRLVTVIVQLSIVILQSYLLISPQYTLLAAELGFLSLLILYEFQSIRCILMSAIVFFISISIRFSGAIIPFIIGGPILLFKYKMKLSRRLLYCILLFFSLFFTTKLIDGVMYGSPEWHSFFEYNHERSFVSDNNILRYGSVQFGDKCKDTELLLLSSFSAQDGNILNADDLRSLYRKYGISHLQLVKDNIIPYCESFFWMYGPICIILFVITIIIGILDGRKDIIVTSTMLILCFLSASIYLMAYSVPKERTIIPCVVTNLFVNLILLRSSSNRYINLVNCVCLIPLILWYGFKCWMADSWNKEKFEAFEEVNTLFSETNVERILCIGNVRTETDVFHYTSTSKAKKTVGSGCNCNSPITKTQYNGYLSFLHGLCIACDKNNMRCIEDIKYQLEHYYHRNVSYKLLNESSSFVIVGFYEHTDFDIL